MFNKLRKMAVVAVTAGALMLGGVGAAYAVPDSIVDADATGSIYLTKYDDAAGKKDADGTKQNVAATPIIGIEFTLTPITGIDFSKNEDLKKAAALDAAKLAAGELPEGINLDKAQASVEVTAEGGKIHWRGLKVGAYLLQETKSKAADGKTYKAAAPSIVFIPTTDPKNQTSWIMDEEGNDKYAVYVYPKNSLDENVKKVVDKDVHAGGDVTFSVEASMPSPNKDEKINDFAFYDKLDPALDINGKDNDVTVQVGDKTLAKGQHFTVTIKDGTQDELWVVLTPAGLEEATNAKATNAGAKAVMTFKAKVLKAAVVPNQAQVYKNTGKGEGTVKPGETPKEPWEKTNTTVSAWGKIKIQKKDEAGNALDGAVFELYQCGADKNGKPTVTGNPIKVGEKTEFTDQGKKDGIIEIDGIHVTDVADNGTVKLPEYCIVEKKAPAKYELRHDPIKVNVALGGITKATEKFEYDVNGVLTSYSNSGPLTELFTMDGSTINVATDVVNIPVKPKLPMTGGAGVALFGFLGLAIIGGGVYAAKRNTKKA
ncbi:SpaH/EbpB family LPXTG-anchored major pilin [Arcanobacterium haemolyticum]|uniref:LPXTG-motif cell wall anchor domain protein n=2 Tax=Arcanobacterium haemolyticum TaxID=28264 RepID=D7BM40_ARCHD|nr:SpaH/EbpB family LPXTG-anchored major pilin [Arcanobacterium haemolyticum]ADH91989.1 LPXTG-motif cell wall anchor domain protein [Arcanobacterium haemolyticum DSM 20595]SQH29309.1 Fimbrial subunit type 1 precursor [Arcanobacterium haemolyticum]